MWRRFAMNLKTIGGINMQTLYESDKLIENTNAKIDEKLGVSDAASYVEYLNKPRTNAYIVRPTGEIEWLK